MHDTPSSTNNSPAATTASSPRPDSVVTPPELIEGDADAPAATNPADPAVAIRSDEVGVRPPDHLPGEAPASENAALIFERS